MLVEWLIFKSFFTGVFISVLFALAGAIVVNKRMSFFADGIAHAVLAGIALGVLLNVSPLFLAVLVAIIFSFLIRSIQRKTKIQADALIGIIFTFGFSLGLLLLLLSPAYRGSLLEYLLGDILAISSLDFWLVFLLLLLVSYLFFKYQRYLILWLVNEDYLALETKANNLFEIIFYLILSTLIVFGLKIVGVILVSALLIIPPTTARLLSRSFKSYLIWSIAISLIGLLLGFTFSYFWNLPTGPTIVLVHALLFFFAFLIFSALPYNIKK